MRINPTSNVNQTNQESRPAPIHLYPGQSYTINGTIMKDGSFDARSVTFKNTTDQYLLMNIDGKKWNEGFIDCTFYSGKDGQVFKYPNVDVHLHDQTYYIAAEENLIYMLPFDPDSE